MSVMSEPVTGDDADVAEHEPELAVNAKSRSSR